MNKTKLHSPTDSVSHFDTLATDWWDIDGPLRTLHEINPFRLQYIRERCNLDGLQVLDVGCGGGILSEALARYGAQVTGLDLAPHNIDVASAHAQEQGLQIAYRCEALSAHLAEHANTYDLVVCMELLEHVDDPAQMVSDCFLACKQGGDVFFSTINRTPKAFATAIVGAEYITGLIPKGTHHYRDLIKPSELAAWCRDAGASVTHLQGFHYAAFTKQHRLCDDVRINYLMHARNTPAHDTPPTAKDTP